VAHGSGTGDNLARTFSNDAESHQSSLGLFRTEDTYVGERLFATLARTDAGFNDHAYDRAIVMHGAPTSATPSHRPGAAWTGQGCPALREALPTSDRHGKGTASSSPTIRAPPGWPHRSTSASAACPPRPFGPPACNLPPPPRYSPA
jgi:hypothetical protein